MLQELSAISAAPKIGSCLVGHFWGLNTPFDSKLRYPDYATRASPRNRYALNVD